MNTEENKFSVVWPFILLIGVGGAAFICYQSVSDIYFIADDFVWLERAKYFKGFASIFKSEGLYFDPLVHLLFRINYIFGGLNQAWYHRVDLLIHIINSLLVAYLALRLSSSKVAAFFSGLIFAISPTNADSVIWPSSRVDTVAALFYLSSILMYLSYKNTLSFKIYFLSIVLFILSLSSKSTPVILPLVISFIEFTDYKKGDFKHRFWRLAPFIAISIIFLILLLYNFPDNQIPHSKGVLNIKELNKGLAVLLFPESLIARSENLYLALSVVAFLLIGTAGVFFIPGRHFFIPMIMVVAVMLPLAFFPASYVYATPFNVSYYLLGSICHRLYLAVIGFSVLVGTVAAFILEKLGKHVRYYFQGLLIMCIFLYGYCYVKEREQIWRTYSLYYKVFLSYIKATEGHSEISKLSNLYLIGPPCKQFTQSAYRIYLNNSNLVMGCLSDFSKLPDLRYSAKSTAVWILRYDWKFIDIMDQVQKYQEVLVDCRDIADRKERENCLLILSDLEENLQQINVTSKLTAELIEYTATGKLQKK